MMHEHTEECENGCTYLSLMNSFLDGILSYGDKSESDETSAEG